MFLPMPPPAWGVSGKLKREQGGGEGRVRGRRSGLDGLVGTYSGDDGIAAGGFGCHAGYV